MMNQPRRLPFTPEMTAAILEGRKTATSRTSRYGTAGDVVESPAGPLLLLWVRRLPLEQIANEHHELEGFDTPEGFRDIWIRLHQRAGWRPAEKVWFHRFERVAAEAKNVSAIIVICDAHEGACVCYLELGHPGAHECNPKICTGSWYYRDGREGDENAFEVVRAPRPAVGTPEGEIEAVLDEFIERITGRRLPE